MTTKTRSTSQSAAKPAETTRTAEATTDGATGPEPATFPKGQVLPETGVDPKPVDDTPATAAHGDTEANGKPTGQATDTSGKLRTAPGGAPTAATGDTEANGRPTEAEGQLTREFGGNGEAQAPLVGGAVADVGAGTGRPAPEDEVVRTPASTVTRTSSNAVPREPADVRRVHEPRRGNPAASTDPTAAALAVQTHAGDRTVALVDPAGNEVVPSEFFEVPEGPSMKGFMIAKHRVSERFTIRGSRTPNQRLLFIEGQKVPVADATLLIELHG